ncbi:hypothetical protein BDA99DRAFT_548509 [Phascolomyces articulosus]|uniref:SET domain-containing protein n=1 Tax=Phascolomyces articulosus TaxID=60185 RepID=A0AAD5PA64_9FUNG|nr:hypothetical protein BDA99DRAFT_548509 [Phascolomyces articulosus]
MEDAVHNDLRDLKDDYKSIVVPLIEEYPYIFKEGDFSFDLFCRISTLISSRAFEVDAFHENAMVPFADIFNHRSGDEHVHFVTDFDVCDACGELEYCEHQYLEYLEQGSDAGDDDDQWSDMEDDEKMSQASGISLKSEDENVDEEDDEEDDEGPLQDLEELEDAQVNFWKKDEEKEKAEEEEKKDTCDMILEQDIKKGEEIFNTYGQHPNIVLLSKYGFCQDNNENDYISVGQDTVYTACVEAVLDGMVGDKKVPKHDQDELIEEAMERVQERFGYYLTNEHIFCPKPDDDDDEEEDGCCADGCCDGEDHEHGDDEDGCCGGDHDYDHEHGHNHDHHGDDEDEDEEGEEDEDDDEEEEGGKPQPYFANVEGLYEDTVMLLLHVVFVNDRTFGKFKEDIGEALAYFERLAEESQKGDKKSRKNTEHLRTKKLVYTVCKRLSELRRKDYLDDKDQWTPIEKDIESRNKITNKRHYYALTCRISEKKIIEKSIEYYDSRVKSCDTEAVEAKTRKKQKN